jgi:hypothetical protein
MTRVELALASRYAVAALVLGPTSLLGACSAGGGSQFGNGTNNSGGDGNLIGGNGGSSGSSGNGSGGALTADSNGLVGPPSTDTCSDKGKFQGASGSTHILYPYDGTIFPRGLGAPLLMWDSAADQILIEAHSQKWSYVDCPTTGDKVRYQLPAIMWAGAASYSGGTGDPLSIKVTTLSGGKATGTSTFSVKFANASLKGAIYYNTYGTTLPGVPQGLGAVLKLLPGDAQPSVFLSEPAGVPLLGPCVSCHALSANGNVMTANTHTYPGFYVSKSYDVTKSPPAVMQASLPEAGFAGLFPDGSRLMTNGPPTALGASIFFPTAPGNVTALTGSTAKMLDPKTGQQIPLNGWDAPHAQMPMFSPDGRHLVYNDYDKGGGHALWVADFDPASNTFSGQRKIFEDGNLYPSWPFFTPSPDPLQVVFTLGTRSDYSSQIPDPNLPFQSFSGWPTPQACNTTPNTTTCVGRGHLMMVDVPSGRATALDAANGYSNGKSYLPAGEDRDNNLEFYPTVSPFIGGGFAWVFFTSRRTYGNLLTKDYEQPDTKKIWVTAVNVAAPAGSDPSSPAFLLPGQELDSGNLRAFTALEPCREDGTTCKSGLDCCAGFCSNIDPTTGEGHCGKPPTVTCAHADEKCAQDSDCCTGPDNGANGRAMSCLKAAGSAYCGELLQ